MKVSIKKVIIFTEPRKDENCKSNANRLIYGAIVFNSPVGINSPTNAVNLTNKELNMLCSDLDVKATDDNGDVVRAGVPVWHQLKALVNRHGNAKADVEVEERKAGDTYMVGDEEKMFTTNSSSVRVTMIDLSDGAVNRMYLIEQSLRKSSGFKLPTEIFDGGLGDGAE